MRGTCCLLFGIVYCYEHDHRWLAWYLFTSDLHKREERMPGGLLVPSVVLLVAFPLLCKWECDVGVTG